MLVTGLIASTATYASCGSVSCSLNNTWDELNTSQHGWGIDMRYSYTKADTLRAGSKRIEADPTNDEVENLHTTNEILAATIDYATDEQWGISMYLPYVKRNHRHSLGGVGGLTGEVEEFKASALGDIKVIGRYRRALHEESNSSLGVKFGLKLNTGSRNVQFIGGGVPDEIRLQLGNGSTDLILGVFWQHPTPGTSWSHFAQASLQKSINALPNFKPGNQINLDVGSRYLINKKFSGIFQASAQQNSADTGLSAMVLPGGAASSGGRIFSVTTGLSYAITHETQLYGLAQIPVYQSVNGEQLTSNSVFHTGLSRRF